MNRPRPKPKQAPGTEPQRKPIEATSSGVRSACTPKIDTCVAVRGGGHSFPGLSTCDGGIVIDLSAMRGIRVDPSAPTARAQAGVLLGELDRETQAFGLAVPAGVVPPPRPAGRAAGGGEGRA